MTLKILVCKCKTFLIQKCWTLVQTDATVNTSGRRKLIIDHFSAFIDNFSTFMPPKRCMTMAVLMLPVLTEATIDEKMLNTGTNWCHPYPIEDCKLFTKIGIHTSKSVQTTKRQENLEWKGVLGSLTYWSMTLKLKVVVMRCPISLEFLTPLALVVKQGTFLIQK